MKKKYIHLEIGQRLKEYRENLTQKEFALKINVPLVTYQRYESGERLPPEPVLKRVAKLCGKTADWRPVCGKGMDPAEGYADSPAAQYSFLEKFGLLSEEEKELLVKTMEVLRGTNRDNVVALKSNIRAFRKSRNYEEEEDVLGQKKRTGAA